MTLWMEGTGGGDEIARNAGGRRADRLVTAGAIFEDVTDSPAPSITTSKRRVWFVDD